MANRLTTWTFGQVLGSTALNAEFNNIYGGTIDRTAGRWGTVDLIPATFGSSQNAVLQWDTNQTQATLMLGIATGSGGSLLVVNKANMTTNYGIAAQSNPAIIVHSNTTTAANAIRITHDDINGVIDALAGGIDFQTAGISRATITASGWTFAVPGILTVTNTTINATSEVLRLIHTNSSGTPTTAMGASLTFGLPNASGTAKVPGSLDVVWADATAGSEDADLVYRAMTAGAALAEKFRVSSTGVINVPTGGSYQINSTSVLTSTTLGSGVTASSLTSVGTLTALAVSATPVFTVTNTVVNATTTVLALTHTNSSGTPTVGMGAGISFTLPNANNAQPSNGAAGGVNISWLDATAASEDSQFSVSLMAAGAAAANKLTLSSVGDLSLVGLVNAASYTIGATSVLNSTTLGSGVVASSLTSVGTLSSLTVSGHVTFEGVTSTGATGTGKLVFDGTPTLVTPVLGAATYTTLVGNNVTNSTRNTGDNTVGPSIFVGRNSNASTHSGAGGTLALVIASGTTEFMWCDNAGNYRTNSAAPTGSANSPTVDDLAGQVIGTQTSWHEKKSYTPTAMKPADALAALLATPIYDFTYKVSSFMGVDDKPAKFTGVVIEEKTKSAWYAMNVGRQQLPTLNNINAIGYFTLAIQALAARVKALEGG